MDVTVPDANARLAETRRIFQRILAQWASDLLALQAHGERRPTWSAHVGASVTTTHATPAGQARRAA